MPGKVVFEITRGARKGQRYTFEETNRIFIGRQEDCGIIMPENTVSRYHCLVDIRPPVVKLQDFGSLNGTFLNEKKIGQRDRNRSWEEAKEEPHEEYELHDGDVLRLGKNCELKCLIELPRQMQISNMATIMEPAQEKTAAKPEDVKERQKTEPVSNPVPARSGLKTEKRSAAKPADKQRVCKGCGKQFTPVAADNNLCSDCLADRAKILDGILDALLENAGQGQNQALPSLVAGYDKVSLLGKGGMGEVWKVRDKKTGKIYALKTMLPQAAADERAKKLFLREASVCKCLNNKNVVRTYETGNSNGVFYILMDLCEGGSVDELMNSKGGKLSLELATYIILQALAGLDYVHNMDLEVEIKKGLFGGTREASAKGVVHRDFKPGNIFLADKSDHPKAMVADFGMAKAYATAGLSNISKSGTVMGTPVFMPRQQALNCKYAKPEVDVWAAAASYYNMLTGVFPKNFRRGVNPWQIIVTESAVPIRQRSPQIPERLASVIDRALVERPEIGCRSAAELRGNIIAALPQDVRSYCKGVLL